MGVRGRIEGHARIAADPEVVQLTDNGKRKVMLRFRVERFEFEVELRDPAAVERSIEYARIWVSEG